jgi:DNA-binding NtrC family response regulator
LESEIFGSEKTPSGPSHQPGKLELAHYGTLIFDNLDELPWDLQEKISLFLKTQVFQRVGGQEAIYSQARVMGTSRKDPQKLLSAQRLHPQLYQQLHQLHIHLPPLAAQKEGIEDLAHTLLSSISQKMHKPILGFSPEVQDFLASYAWPGNLRQLQNILERAVILEESKWIQKQSLFFPEMNSIKTNSAFMHLKNSCSTL